MDKMIFEATKSAINELCEKAGVKRGQTVVVGCSTSEVIGSKIGTASSPETAKEIFAALKACADEKGFFLAVQCCEHLNRAIVISREGAKGVDEVNVRPVPKAGGSLAAAAYEGLCDPVVIESVRADAGLDIGATMIGMHLKAVAVPLRLENNKIGEAPVFAARTRAKFIGGARAQYNENLL